MDLTEVSPATGKPVFAIATHAHVDHIGSFHRYARRGGHLLEAHTFADMDDAGTVESWFRTQEQPVAKLPYPGWRMEDFGLKVAPLTQQLDEGDIVDLGDRKFMVLHLPGHSPGSIALFDEHHGELFSGDAIYVGGLVDDVPGADVQSYLRTMTRLLDLEIRIGHGGHGPSFDNSQMQQIAHEYIRSKDA
ncbi:MBL fold metallo-hydrolase [Rhizobium setariae]